MSRCRGDVAGGFAFLISKATVSAGSDEQSYDLRHPGAGGNHKRGVALVILQVVTHFALQEITNNSLEAPICGENQWRVAVRAAAIETCTVVQKNLRRLCMSVFQSREQGCLTILVGNVLI